MKKFPLLSIVFIVLFFIGCSKDENQPEPQELTVVSYIGDVSVTSKEGTAAAKVGLKLNEGDIIKAGSLSSADFSIGKDGVARISEKTTLRVETIAKTGGAGNTMKLDNGRFSVVLSKLSRKDSFTVRTNTAVAAVRGTGFRISSENGSAKIEVVSGKVLVSPAKDGVSIDNAAVVVEKNSLVVIDEKKAAAAEKGEVIKVETIPAADIKSITDEMKTLPVAPNADESLKEEIKSIVDPSETVVPVVRAKATNDKSADQTKKAAAVQKAFVEAEKQNELKEKEAAEKLAVAEKEASEKAAADKEVKAAQEKKEKKEARVKNIPTI